MQSRIICSILMCAVLALTRVHVSRGDNPHGQAAQYIQRAGSADSDELRLAVLKELRASGLLESDETMQLDRFIAFVGKWIDPPALDWFSREFGRQGHFDFGVAAESPLFPLTHLYLGRMWVWTTLEDGGLTPETRRERFARARSEFEQAVRAFPDDRISRSYLGEPIPPAKTYDSPASAPSWAKAEREALERLTDIIDWWIAHRMHPDGQYGGGWGDDCEMWRWWTPVLIGFRDETIDRAQARFSDAMMHQPHMSLGYTRDMYDVEHTAEDSADTITPMMHLDPDNPVWAARASRLGELMEKLWTGKNERGYLQFRSTYFAADRVSKNAQEACDTVYHPRAVQPTLLLWQRTGDERLTRLFRAWMDTWVDATQREERGKPAGIIPSAIHWPDGKIGGLSGDWWDPRNHREHTLYLWPSVMEFMTDTLLLTYHMTGDEKYLAPIRSMAQMRLEYVRHPPTMPPEPGTKMWCASQLTGPHDLSGMLAKYRLLTGDRSFDELLSGAGMEAPGGRRKAGPGYMQFYLNGDIEPLQAALERTAEALRFNFHGYTSEVRYTDRVLRFPSLFARDGIVRPDTPIRRPDTQLLYSTTTGDPGSVGYFPMNAVRWLTPPREIAVLVRESSKRSFEAELYHFGKMPRLMGAELYNLHPGTFAVHVTALEDGKESETSTANVTGRSTRVSFTLPAQKLCRLRVDESR